MIFSATKTFFILYTSQYNQTCGFIWTQPVLRIIGWANWVWRLL